VPILVASARLAIYSRDTAIRIRSVPQLRYKNPFVEISSRDKVASLAEFFCRPLFVWIFQIWPYPRHNPWWWPEVLAWQASPWEHRPSSSALQLYVWGPCNFLVFVKTSGTSLVLNNERYLAFYQPFLKRFSRAPYFVFLFFLYTFSTPLREVLLASTTTVHTSTTVDCSRYTAVASTRYQVLGT
jgi:hypothetical protein